MKISCRLFTLIISFALIIQLTLPTSAIHLTEPELSFEEQVAELTSSVLYVVEQDKAGHGMATVDFENLVLGNQIHAYSLTSSGLIAETEVYFFPIVCNNEWVATSMVTEDSIGSLSVQVSIQYASAYEGTFTPDSSVALIFDAESVYLYANGQLTKAADSLDATANRVNINDYSGEITLPSSVQTETVVLQIEAPTGMSTRALSDYDNQFYLNVPNILQNANSNECWAACVASISGYYGNSTTIDAVLEFYQEYDSNFDPENGGSIADAKIVLRHYGFSPTLVVSDIFNWHKLRLELCHYENLIYAACTYSNNRGHAVVIRGFYVYHNINQLGIITYMDPLVGSSVSSTVATDYAFNYVPSGSLYSYPMESFLVFSSMNY